MRVGIGVDAHPFVSGRPLILGGVDIPFDRGLDGHSDADVLTHAIIDALLGAASMGDIGTHFPSSDGRFAGARGLDLLRSAADLIAGAGFRVGNVDAVVIAQAPPLAPYRAEMVAAVAGALDIPPGVVSVKATTTDRMGFTGRDEGIAAMAVALVHETGT